MVLFWRFLVRMRRNSVNSTLVLKNSRQLRVQRHKNNEICCDLACRHGVTDLVYVITMQWIPKRHYSTSKTASVFTMEVADSGLWKRMNRNHLYIVQTGTHCRKHTQLWIVNAARNVQTKQSRKHRVPAAADDGWRSCNSKHAGNAVWLQLEQWKHRTAAAGRCATLCVQSCVTIAWRYIVNSVNRMPPDPPNSCNSTWAVSRISIVFE